MTSASSAPARVRPARVVFLLLVALLVGMVSVIARPSVILIAGTWRTTPVYNPPVLAGQRIVGGCSGGVYARSSDGRLVVTSTGHCADGGTPVTLDDGRFLGIFSAPSRAASCDRPGKDRCTASDMAYVAIVPAMIPWGRLNLVDMGAGGYRVIAPGTAPRACADVKSGDTVEFDGRSYYRTGQVVGQEVYDFPEDGTYFPCITMSTVDAASGDSGGLVLVGGFPAGVAAREVNGYLGFTPLAEGLAEMGLTMCDTPDCGLVPPAH
jgi:hypothetical protein